MRPWCDRQGRFSWLKAVVFAALLLPGLWLAGRVAAGTLGPRPITEFIHQTGLWAIRLLLVSLAVTPLRRSWQWPQMIQVRRMIGVAAFAYAAVHLLGYMADQAFDLPRIATEIVVRVYLAIGAATLLILAALAVTSTDGMLRRLGGKTWQRLHRLVYAACIAGMVHFFMQAKLEITEPTIMAGLLLWLLAWRAVPARVKATAFLAGLGVGAGLATMAAEAAWFSLAYHADPWQVFAANASLALGPRPGAIVLAVGLLVAAIAAVRGLMGSAPKARSVQNAQPAPTTATPVPARRSAQRT